MYYLECHKVGPCLFLCYISDLPENLLSKTKLFDPIAYLTIKSDLEPDVLQSDLDKLAEWYKLWDKEFNSEKCEVIHARWK